MAADVVQVGKTVVNTGTGTEATGALTGVTAGNALVLIVLEYCQLGSGSHLAVPTSAKLDNTTLAAADFSFEAADATFESMRVTTYHWLSVAAGSHSVSMVYPAAPGFPSNNLYFLIEVSGMASVSPVDGAGAGAAGTATAASSGTATTTNSDDLWLGFTTSLATTPTFTAGMGSIPVNGSETNSAANLCGAVEKLSNPGVTSKAATFTLAAGAWVCGVIAYKSAAGGGAAPFIPNVIPNPNVPSRFPIELRTFVNAVEYTLIGKDQFFRGPGQGPNYDWPNPIGPRRVVTLYDEPPNLLASTLKPVSAQPPFRNYDIPNPRIAGFPLELRTSATWFMVDDSVPFTPPDWTNPRLRVRSMDSYTWSVVPPTVVVQLPPFKQTDWPNPRGYVPSMELRTFVNAVELQLIGQDRFFGLAGNPNFDQPNPRGYAYPTDLRTFLNAVESQLIGLDQFFGAPGERVNADFPNPRIAGRGVEMGYVLNLLESTLGIIVPSPFFISDWPNPIARVPATSLRTHVDSTRLQLIGQDRMFGAPGQVPTYDWTNPLRRVPGIDLRTFIVDIIGGTLSLVPPPFRQTDWPNPTLLKFPLELRTGIGYYVIDKSIPFMKPEQPNPRGYTYPVSLRTHASYYTINNSMPFREQQFPNPIGYRQPIDLKTFLLGMQDTLRPPVFLFKLALIEGDFYLVTGIGDDTVGLTGIGDDTVKFTASGDDTAMESQ